MENRESWNPVLNEFLNSTVGKNVKDFVKKERLTKTIYPDSSVIFRIFKEINFDDVKIVILGESPFPNEHANGIAFSSDLDKMPYSLQVISELIRTNLYDYIPREMFMSKYFTHSNLLNWVRQGILLLNSVYSVEKDKPNSHENKGWELLTELLIKALNKKKDPIVFMFWGSKAKSFMKFVTNPYHKILTNNYPTSEKNAPGSFIKSTNFVDAFEFIAETYPEMPYVTIDYSEFFNTEKYVEKLKSVLKENELPMWNAKELVRNIDKEIKDRFTIKHAKPFNLLLKQKENAEKDN